MFWLPVWFFQAVSVPQNRSVCLFDLMRRLVIDSQFFYKSVSVSSGLPAYWSVHRSSQKYAPQMDWYSELPHKASWISLEQLQFVWHIYHSTFYCIFQNLIHKIHKETGIYLTLASTPGSFLYKISGKDNASMYFFPYLTDLWSEYSDFCFPAFLI